jgi:hypothetical protein
LRKPLPQRWWQYAEKRSAMFRAISDLDRVLVIARVSKTGLPQFVATRQVMSEQVVVFATDNPASLCLLSSSIHFTWWTTKGESTLETRLRYTPSDGFETFPQPEMTDRMKRAGEELDTLRRNVMASRRVGLTNLYNMIYNDLVQDFDIQRLREIHVEIDEAVREAYALDEEKDSGIRGYERQTTSAPLPSWRTIELGHKFYETRQGSRFTIDPQARTDILDKLMVLNHYRYEQETRQGLHSGKARGTSRGKSATRGPVIATPMLDDGGLFAPEGTLF